jgi:hypothetical protein
MENQQIYLWTGLEADGSQGGLLQPVLAWGPWHSGGGAFWSISSWYFQHPPLVWDPNPPPNPNPDPSKLFASTPSAFQTPAIRVNPGQTLIAFMGRTPETETGHDSSGLPYFDYLCEFHNNDGTVVAGTSLHLSLFLLRLNACYVTLEVGDGVTTSNHYPNTDKMTFSNITIRAAGSQQDVNWQELNPSIAGGSLTCGEHAKAVPNNALVTSVDLYFKNFRG